MKNKQTKKLGHLPEAVSKYVQHQQNWRVSSSDSDKRPCGKKKRKNKIYFMR